MLEPTYRGLARTSEDVIILFNACNEGTLTPLMEKPAKVDLMSPRPGFVFIWDFNQVNMQRWHDGITWGRDKSEGIFRTYQLGRLIKQTCRMELSSGSRMHLVQYFDAQFLASDPQTPTKDTTLANTGRRLTLRHFPSDIHASSRTTSSVLLDKLLLPKPTKISANQSLVLPLMLSSENQPKATTKIPIDPLLIADAASQCFSRSRDAETDPIIPNEEDGVLEYLAPGPNFGHLWSLDEAYRASSFHSGDCPSTSQPGVTQIDALVKRERWACLLPANWKRLFIEDDIGMQYHCVCCSEPVHPIMQRSSGLELDSAEDRMQLYSHLVIKHEIGKCKCHRPMEFDKWGCFRGHLRKFHAFKGRNYNRMRDLKNAFQIQAKPE